MYFRPRIKKGGGWVPSHNFTYRHSSFGRLTCEPKVISFWNLPRQTYRGDRPTTTFQTLLPAHSYYSTSNSHLSHSTQPTPLPIHGITQHIQGIIWSTEHEHESNKGLPPPVRFSWRYWQSVFQSDDRRSSRIQPDLLFSGARCCLRIGWSGKIASLVAHSTEWIRKNAANNNNYIRVTKIRGLEKD